LIDAFIGPGHHEVSIFSSFCFNRFTLLTLFNNAAFSLTSVIVQIKAEAEIDDRAKL